MDAITPERQQVQPFDPSTSPSISSGGASGRRQAQAGLRAPDSRVMLPLSSLAHNEALIYSLADTDPSIQHSTLVVIRRGPAAAHVVGEIEFAGDVRLRVDERLLFIGPAGRIVRYGYEVWRGAGKLYWYDSQSHPNEPVLASTHPHHKHIPPDIKHNRIPAPDLSFDFPNLPFLIEEIERQVLGQ